MKTKVAGISILVAMGTSLVVLSLAFATLTSIGLSVEQASNIQRSTQLFFASEAGAEAAFFHHNARGPGLDFTGTPASQTIELDNINATTQWTIAGRTEHINSATGQDAIIVDILKEGQTYQIPLEWNTAGDPMGDLSTTRPDLINHDLEVIFFQSAEDFPNSTAKTEFQERYGFDSNAFDPLRGSFDFGDTEDDQILIDWSVTRKNNVQGVQTFIPFNNQNCVGYSPGAGLGYICENDIQLIPTGDIRISTTNQAEGRILPGSVAVRLDEFWDCRPGTPGVATIGESCTDYQITLRPLLKFEDTTSGEKVPGIPFQLRLVTGNGIPELAFPKNYYTVTSDVTQENFSQRIEIDVPVATSIGAFDYVIFD